MPSHEGIDCTPVFKRGYADCPLVTQFLKSIYSIIRIFGYLLIMARFLNWAIQIFQIFISGPHPAAGVRPSIAQYAAPGGSLWAGSLY
jgi:hypothetical protein